jgi:putative NADH-flavin reductase
MSRAAATFLVLGGTGGTGKHFITLALRDGHKIRALVRSSAKLPPFPPGQPIEVIHGSITDPTLDLHALVKNTDYIVCMLGDKEAQATQKINLPFIQRLVPAMRTHGVKRLLYQAGGLSRSHGGSLSPLLWIVRNTIARGFEGQHQDNEAVATYLATEAQDVEWIYHRAGIGSDGPSKGRLERELAWPSIGTHVDCADYSLRLVQDARAVHTADFSRYASS